MTTRYVALIGEMMVVGEGATAEAAMADARNEARMIGCAGDHDDAEIRAYDPGDASSTAVRLLRERGLEVPPTS